MRPPNLRPTSPPCRPRPRSPLTRFLPPSNILDLIFPVGSWRAIHDQAAASVASPSSPLCSFQVHCPLGPRGQPFRRRLIGGFEKISTRVKFEASLDLGMYAVAGCADWQFRLVRFLEEEGVFFFSVGICSLWRLPHLKDLVENENRGTVSTWRQMAKSSSPSTIPES